MFLEIKPSWPGKPLFVHKGSGKPVLFFSIWRFPKMGSPKSSYLFIMEHPKQKWRRTGATPIFPCCSVCRASGPFIACGLSWWEPPNLMLDLCWWLCYFIFVFFVILWIFWGVIMVYPIFRPAQSFKSKAQWILGSKRRTHPALLSLHSRGKRLESSLDGRALGALVLPELRTTGTTCRVLFGQDMGNTHPYIHPHTHMDIFAHNIYINNYLNYIFLYTLNSL